MQRLLRFNNKPLTILALATLFFVELLPALAASHGEDKGALNVETPALSPTSVTTENAGTGKGAVQSTTSVPANTPLVDPSLFAGPPEPSPSAGFSADAVTRALSSAVGNFHVVSPMLYRGAQPTEAGMAALQKAGVGTVVSFRNEPKVLDEEKRQANKLGLNFVNIPMAVFEPLRQDQIDKFLKLVQQSTKPVFCHCQFGQDRTGVMVAMYRMTQDGWSGDQALKEMLAYGFKPELLNYSNAVVTCSRNLGRPATPPTQDYILADVKKRIGKILNKNH